IVERARVHPRHALVGPPVWRHTAEDRLAKLRDASRCCWGRICRCADGAPRAHHELERRFDLRAKRGAREELRAFDDRSHDLRDVAIRSPERLGRTVDQRGGWIIAHQSAGELERDVMRGRWMTREDIEHLLTILDATTGL